MSTTCPPGRALGPLSARPFDASAAVDRVRDDFSSRPWSLLRGRLLAEEFDAVLAGLGREVSRFDMMVSPHREEAQRAARRNNVDRPSLYQASEMRFHSDPGGVDVLAFHCIAQDATGGANLLIDLTGLERDFPPEEIEVFGRIPVSYPVFNADGVEEMHQLALVRPGRKGPLVHYLPWGIGAIDDPALARGLADFERYVASRPVHAIRLEPGEALFLDNGRVLHGRASLPQDSARRLTRVHLSFEPA